MPLVFSWMINLQHPKATADDKLVIILSPFLFREVDVYDY